MIKKRLQLLLWSPDTDVNMLKLKLRVSLTAQSLINFESNVLKYRANATKICQFYYLWTTLYAEKIVRNKTPLTDRNAVYNCITVCYWGSEPQFSCKYLDLFICKYAHGYSQSFTHWVKFWYITSTGFKSLSRTRLFVWVRSKDF